MAMLLELSLIALCLVVSAQGAVTYVALAEATNLRRAIERHPKRVAAAPALVGKPAPAFAARVLDEDRVVSTPATGARALTIIFLDASETALPSGRIEPGIAHLLNRFPQQTYVVCASANERCRSLKMRLSHLPKASDITILLDEAGELAHTFRVPDALSAVIIDEEGTVSKVGELGFHGGAP